MTSGKSENVQEINSLDNSSNFLNKLKIKWGLENLVQVVLVLIVFAITGSTVVLLRKSLFFYLGFDETTSMVTKTSVYLLFIFPAYQILLLFFGFFLGQFNFFWNKEKRLIKILIKPFRKTAS